MPGSDSQTRAVAAAMVQQALGVAPDAVDVWDGRWVRRWVREVTGARATLAAELVARPKRGAGAGRGA